MWHKGNDPVGCHPIDIIVVDVDLQDIQRHQLASFSKHCTHSPSFIECVVASYEVVSARKKVRSAHIKIPKVRFRVREGRKGER